jgi:spermidine dehydrogenase
MKKGITRRDFLNGAALSLAAGATLTPRELLAMEQGGAPGVLPKDYYPPTLTGMRGSHEGSFEVAHALGWRGERPRAYTRLDDSYDLVVVGGGLSGLAAAYLYRQQAGADKKILILENHDDFGGHAKRNEFHSGGRMLLGIGGSNNLESYAFSDTVNRVLEELGVDLEKLEAACEPNYILSDISSYGLFLNAKQFGKDRLVEGNWQSAWQDEGDVAALVSSLGLPAEQQQRLVALIEGERDLLDDLSLLEAKRYVESTSYPEFLSSRAGLSPTTIALFEPMARMLFGTGLECSSVAENMLLGNPGLKSMGMTGKLLSKVLGFASEGVSFPLFPDGNSSIARLLVRNLIPGVAPGSTMEDVVEARFDYSQLDHPDAPVRVRLNSTAVNAVNTDGGVEISYVQGGNAYTVRAEHCIMACYNGIIPHLCPELPEAQKENLRYGVKIPLVQTNVLLRSGASVDASGSGQYLCPGSFHVAALKSPPVSLGGYKASRKSDDPLVLWMFHAPAPDKGEGLTARDLYRLGRHRLYTTPFATFESEIQQQLDAMFGPKGLDAERDIEAITVNRWAHGYSYEYLQLFDPEWEDGQAPHELGRKTFGRIAIANSDSEASAYVQAAIDAAARAVGELG